MKRLLIRKVKQLSLKTLSYAIFAGLAATLVFWIAFPLSLLNRFEEIQKINTSSLRVEKYLTALYLNLQKSEVPVAASKTRYDKLILPDAFPFLMTAADKLMAQPEIKHWVSRFKPLADPLSGFLHDYSEFRSEFINILPELIETSTLLSEVLPEIDSLTVSIGQIFPDQRIATSFLMYCHRWLEKGDGKSLREIHSLLSDTRNCNSELCQTLTDQLGKLVQKNQLLYGPRKHALELLDHCLISANSLIRRTDELKNRQLHQLALFGVFSFLVFSVCVLLALVFYYQLIKGFIRKIKIFLSGLIEGHIPNAVAPEGTMESKEIFQILNRYAEDLRQKVQFANAIGKGDYNTEYKPLSSHDLLGNALLNLGNNLKTAEFTRKEFEKEEKKRRWTSDANAKLAEVIRLSSTSVNTLTDQVVWYLIREVGASQGALFLTDEENSQEPLLRLVSAFAYNRKKYVNQTFRMGEGLVGTCAIEKNPIYLTDIPEGYIKISSGLGESKPRCLILVPLITDNQVLGVLEIASLREPEPYTMEFLIKSAESIASAISMVQINTRNKILLEQSQRQAHELKEQDRKMRQNIEMLQIAQEEANRREREIADILKAINNSSLVMELDPDSRIISANEHLCQLIGTKQHLLTGKRYATLFNLDISSSDYRQLWDDLTSGKPRHKIESLRLSGGREIWLSLNFTPLADLNQQVNRILCIASDITESKQQEMILQEKTRELLRKNLELETLYHAVDESLIRCVLQPDAVIAEVNSNFLKASGYTSKELIGRNYRAFLEPDMLDQFTKIWN